MCIVHRRNEAWDASRPLGAHNAHGSPLQVANPFDIFEAGLIRPRGRELLFVACVSFASSLLLRF